MKEQSGCCKLAILHEPLCFCSCCNLRLCSLHVYISENDIARCPRCSAPITQKVDFKPITIEGTQPTKCSKNREAIVIIHALHVSGAARNCLELISEFRRAGIFVTVVAIQGGGHWVERFLSAADRVIIARRASELNWHYIAQHSNGTLQFVSAHYTPATLWAIREVPAGVGLFLHFHTEPLCNEGPIRDVLTLSFKRRTTLVFPTEELLSAYRNLLPSTLHSLFMEKIYVLPNALPSTFAELPNCENAQSNNKNSNVAIVSRLDYDKVDIQVLTETISAIRTDMKDVVVLLAGPGEHATEICDAIEAAGLGDTVIPLGFVDNIEEIYRWADVVFLPSYTEVMPYASVEAQAFHRPVVLPAIGYYSHSSNSSDLVRTFSPGNSVEAANVLAAVLKQGHFASQDKRLLHEQSEWRKAVKLCYLGDRF